MSIKRLLSLMLLSLFFASTLTMSVPLDREVFVSPDENATYVFASALADTGRLSIIEPLNLELGGLVHPRSTLGYADSILPSSFVGFIFLLGDVGAIFGKVAMYLVTPALAVMTICLWRDCVQRLFKQPLLADLAAFLLMIHPAFWYYSGRVMMHNVAFLAMLVLGVWWCLAQPLSALTGRMGRRPVSTAMARLCDFGIAGAWFGTTLMIRTSEIIWLTLALLVVIATHRAAIGWRSGLVFASGFLLMLGLLGAINASVYGHALVNGYTASYAYPESLLVNQTETSISNAPRRSLILPFGFHERNIFKNVLNYGWALYPWMSGLALLGIVIAIVEPTDRRTLWRTVTILTLALATWLGVVYGSWMIVDNPDPVIISLGNSHVRYWLPLFALASLFAARAFVYLLGDKSRLKQVGVGALLLLMTLLSAKLVFFGADGFMPNRAALDSFVDKRSRILVLTESDAIVIVDRADKYLFPARRVVVPLRSNTTYQSIPVMLGLAPVYYFGITLPAQDFEYLNGEVLQALGVRIELVETMSEESLYRFILST